MKKIFIFFCITLTLYSSSLKEIYFSGNTIFSSKDLYDLLGLSIKTKRFFSLDKEIPKIKTSDIKSIIKDLKKIYKSEGFYDVEIKYISKKDRVIFKILKKKPLIVKKIVIESDLKGIKRFIDIDVGDRFVTKKFVKSRELIKKYLKNRGYCNADFSFKAYLSKKDLSAKIVCKLKKNRRCRFGKIDIESKKVLKDAISSRLTFKEGDFYSYNLIEDSYQNLIALNSFDIINLKESNFGDKINIKVKTKTSKPTSSFRVGLGYETKYGANMVLHWEKRNFLNEAKKLSFDLKYSAKERYIKNSFFSPAFLYLDSFKRYFDIKNEFTYLYTIYSDFDEKKICNTIHLQDNISKISLDLALDIEHIIIKKIADVPQINGGNFMLISPFLKAMIDDRDSKIDPKNGYMLSAYLETGINDLGSLYPYYKVKLEGRYIKSIEGFTFAIKSKIGFLNDYKKALPASKLFYAGGSFSNRAYGYNKLGASDASANGVGGRTLLDSSLELEHRLYKKLFYAFFVDTTILSTKVFDFGVKSVDSYGFGLRYKTFVGPIKFDVGFNSKDSSIYAIHFQIGQSF